MIALVEIFASIQGEATFAGTPAIFVRLAGCNLNCRFCDTDFAMRSLRSVDEIVRDVVTLAPRCPMVVLTGGEPLAQSESAALIAALRGAGKRVHVESNGTISAELPSDVWLTVSPKERLDSAMAARADEIKLIVDGRVPLEWLDEFPAATPAFLQPEGNKAANVTLALAAAQAAPERLRLSVQIHKFIGVP